MERLIFHIDVNSAFLSWESARRVKQGLQDLRDIPACIGGRLHEEIPLRSRHQLSMLHQLQEYRPAYVLRFLGAAGIVDCQPVNVIPVAMK